MSSIFNDPPNDDGSLGNQISNLLGENPVIPIMIVIGVLLICLLAAATGIGVAALASRPAAETTGTVDVLAVVLTATQESVEQTSTASRQLTSQPPAFVTDQSPAPDLEATTNSQESDRDGDGINDAQEGVTGTNPDNPDSDGDNLPDGEEVSTWTTDPLNIDTDGDTLNDGDEVHLYKSSPTIPDTDGDGFQDGLEVSMGSDHLNPMDPGSAATPTPESVQSQPTGRIAFVSDHDGPDSLYVMDVTRPEQAQRITQATGYDWWPAWCGADTLVFERGDDIWNTETTEIARVSALGDGLIQGITSNNLPASSKMNGLPSCSPDGAKLSFSSLSEFAPTSSEFTIGTVEMNSPDPPFQLIGDGYALGGRVSWSPDGKIVFFFHLPDGESDFEIYRVDLNDPFNFTNLTNNYDGNSKYPSVSPDGGQVAFACGIGEANDRQWSLCLTPAGSSSVSVLMTNLHFGSERDSVREVVRHAVTPSWSPDGQWLAFASDMDGDWDVYIYSLNTRNLINLTDTWPTDEFHPTWGPG